MTELAQRRILIVDDSPEDRATFRRFLEKDPEHSYTILEAETGEEGFALCGSQDVDCVLLDYQLPDFDGLDFLARLKAEKKKDFFSPVVMLTGAGNEAVAVQAMKSGAQDYLPKGTL